MEKQEEPTSTGENVEEVGKLKSYWRRIKAKWDKLLSFIPLMPELASAAGLTIYPPILRRQSIKVQVLVVLFVIAALISCAIFAWNFFIKYMVRIIAVVLGIGLMYVIAFRSPIPKIIGNWLTSPFRLGYRIFFNKWWKLIFTIPLGLLWLFVARGLPHPYVIEGVSHVLNVVSFANILIGVGFYAFGKKWLALGNVVIFLVIHLTGAVNIMAYQARFQDLTFTETTHKFLTKEDYWYAPETIDVLMSDTKDTDEKLTPSDFYMKDDGSYGYTAAITARSPVTQITTPHNIGGIAKIESDTNLTTDIDRGIRFQVERPLYFTHSLERAVIKGFNPLEYFTVSIGNTLRLPCRDGKMCIVVLLDRLTIQKNFLLMPTAAYPAPYGVVVVEEGLDVPYWKLALFGKGEFIPMSEVHKHDFLKGQILVSERSLEMVGNSGKYIIGEKDEEGERSWNFIATYADPHFSILHRKAIQIDRMNDGSLVKNIVHVDEDINGERVTAFFAMLPMVGLRNFETQTQTWYIRLDGDPGEVIRYHNFNEGDTRPSASVLVETILAGDEDRNMAANDYTVLNIHSSVKEVMNDGEMIPVEANLSTVARLDENGRPIDRDIVHMIAVKAPGGIITRADLYNDKWTIEEHIIDMLNYNPQ